MSATESPKGLRSRRAAAEKDESASAGDPAPSETRKRGGIPFFVPLLLVLALVIAAMPSNRELLATKLPGPLREWIWKEPVRRVDENGNELFT
jgi:hypothetical protein